MGSILSHFAFLPPSPSYDATLPNLVWINAELPALLLDLEHSDPSDPPFTVLFSHGNAEDLGQIRPWLCCIRDYCGVQILAYEYQGYGLRYDAKHPTEDSVYRDALAAYLYLVDNLRVPAKKIVLFGRSLGSGPTVHLAAELFAPSPPTPALSWFTCGCRPNPVDHIPCDEQRCPGGIILQSPLASVLGVVSLAAARLAPRDMFSNLSKIPRVRCPALIVHGRRDAVVPFAHSEALCSAAPCVWEFLAVPDAGHNNLEELYAQPYLDTVKRFLRFLQTDPPASRSPRTAPQSPSSSLFPCSSSSTQPLMTNSDTVEEEDL